MDANCPPGWRDALIHSMMQFADDSRKVAAVHAGTGLVSRNYLG